MRKKLALILSTVLILVICSGCGGSQSATSTQQDAPAPSAPSAAPSEADEATQAPVDKVFIQLGHADAEVETAIHHKMALLFQQYVDEMSNGTMEIEIVGSGQLGGERDMVEGMQLGTIEMASTANMVLSNFMPEFGVLDLPYVFSDYESAYRALDSNAIQTVIEKFAAEKGVRVLAFAQGGFRQVVGNKAVLEVEDLKGMKIRVPESDIYIDTFNALGAAPTPLAWAETFTAMQQKTVDAFEITPAVVLSNGFFEVCSDISVTNHLFSPNPLMISESLYKSLTEEQQKVLKDAAVKAANEQRAWIESSTEEVYASLEEKGMKVDRPDLSGFQAVVESAGLYEKYAERIGADLIDAVMKAAAA